MSEIDERLKDIKRKVAEVAPEEIGLLQSITENASNLWNRNVSNRNQTLADNLHDVYRKRLGELRDALPADSTKVKDFLDELESDLNSFRRNPPSDGQTFRKKVSELTTAFEGVTKLVQDLVKKAQGPEAVPLDNNEKSLQETLENVITAQTDQREAGTKEGRNLEPEDVSIYKECEEKSCCPPQTSRFETAGEYRHHLMRKEMSFASRVLGFFFFIGSALLGFAIFVIYRLVRILTRYFNQMRRKKTMKNQILNRFREDDRRRERNKQDYRPDLAENNSDYYRYQQGINQLIKQYSDHNKYLRKFFDARSTPGLINRQILHPQNDDW